MNVVTQYIVAAAILYRSKPSLALRGQAIGKGA
jgi:hypothetical protein